jgi:hypothetical protein
MLKKNHPWINPEFITDLGPGLRRSPQLPFQKNRHPLINASEMCCKPALRALFPVDADVRHLQILPRSLTKAWPSTMPALRLRGAVMNFFGYGPVI